MVSSRDRARSAAEHRRPDEGSEAPRERDRGRSATEDVVLPHAPTADGTGIHVLRKRGESIEAGVLRAAQEGRPVVGELIALRPRSGTPLFDVEVIHDARPRTKSGPPMVASAAYREGWARIFEERARGSDDSSPTATGFEDEQTFGDELN